MVIKKDFFKRDALEVAPELVGKLLVRKVNNKIIKLRISEVEVYKGEEDTACHAHKGKTKRTEIMYEEGGKYYVYLCYGMHYLLNIVTGKKDNPQAVLIRATVEADGPGKLTKVLEIDKSFNGKEVLKKNQLWVEDDGYRCEIQTDKRVGIAYASKEDQERLWRFKCNCMKIVGATSSRP